MSGSWIDRNIAVTILGQACTSAICLSSVQMPLNIFVSNLEKMRLESECGASVWHLGETIEPDALGALGCATTAQPTLLDALRTFERGLPAFQSNSLVACTISDDEVHVSYRVLDPQVWPRQADAELTLGILQNICGRYGVRRNALSEICFEAQPDKTSDALTQYLRITPHFEECENSLRFPARFLNNRLSTEFINNERKYATDTLDEILSELHKNLLFSQIAQIYIQENIGQSVVSEMSLSQVLGISERSLRRRLADEGVKFRTLFNDFRRIQSAFLIAHSRKSLSEIAQLLNYSDQTTFSRAFVRWYGISPGKFRKISFDNMRMIV